MTSLADLIRKYFPLETIQKQYPCQLESSFQTSKEVRYNKWSQKYNKAVEIIETDKKIYFDLRPFIRYPESTDLPSLIKKLMFPSIGAVAVTIVGLLMGGNTLGDLVSVGVGLLIFLIFLYILLFWLNSEKNNIQVISKDWIKNLRKENNVTIIEGEFVAPFNNTFSSFLKHNKPKMSDENLFFDHKSSLRLVKTYKPGLTKFVYQLQNS